MRMKYAVSLMASAILAYASASSGIDFNKDGTDDLLVHNGENGQVYSWLMKSDGTRASYKYVATIDCSTWRIEGMGDFNGDGVTDVLVRNGGNGQVYSWLMKEDGSRAGYQYITTLPSEWEIAGTTSDFNKDGINDIVVRNRTKGWTYIWMMKNDGSRASYKYVTTIPAADWEIAGTASDFNGDGVSDIVVRNLEHGWTYIWLMNSDGSRESYNYVTTIPAADWEIAGTTSDFNRDGINDIVVRNRTKGWTYVWLMKSDGSRESYKYITTLSSDWEIVETDAEFDGDGTSDLVVRKRDTGDLYIWFMRTDGSREGFRFVTRIPAMDWEIVGAKYDFNRDGTNDIVVRKLADGSTYSWEMSTTGARSSIALIATIPVETWTIAGTHSLFGAGGVCRGLKYADWAAYEENGAWKVIESKTFVFIPKTEKYGVAVHCSNDGFSTTYIYQYTKSELPEVPIVCGGETTEKYYRVEGSVSGVTGNDMVSVSIGGAQTMLFGNGSYAIDDVTEGKHDVLAVETELTNQKIVKFGLHRDIDVDHNLTGIDVALDISSVEHTFTTTGSYGHVSFHSKNGSSFSLIGDKTWYALTSGTVEGDVYKFMDMVFDANLSKMIEEGLDARNDPGDKSMDVKSVADFNVTVDEALYTTFSNLNYTPASTSPEMRRMWLMESQSKEEIKKFAMVFISKGWLEGATSYTMPDFTGLSGWQDIWSFESGKETQWSAMVEMSNRDLTEWHDVPYVVHTSGKNGSFTP